LRSKATFVRQDIRDRLNAGPFHIVFCRNMAFTYFDTALQREMLKHIRRCLVDGGALIIGGHESLPDGYSGFEQWSKQRAIFKKVTGTSGE
jgi:chemotaxis protein methyltransferase CheR